MKYVIDASFIASLFLPDEANAAIDRFATRIMQAGAAAPAILQLEITNILLMAQRRKRISGVQAQQISEAFNHLPVVLQPALMPAQRADVLHLAQKHGLTAYDAAYLELAMRLSASLATLDTQLVRAAKAEGISSVP